MRNFLPLALAAVVSVPAFAGEFGAEIDAGAIRGEFRASAAASAPQSPYASAPPLPYVAPERLSELQDRATEWPDRKADAKAALDAEVESMIRNGGDEADWRGLDARVWQVAQSAEIEQDILYNRVYDRIAGETSDPGERQARQEAAASVARFRKYTIYANMLPRVIDEAHVNAQGEPDGRLYAGPRWALPMTWAEAQSVNRVLIPRTGISPDDYAAMDADVSKQYMAANPLTPEPGQR